MTLQRMWITAAATLPDPPESPQQQPFEMPRGIRLVDVEFPLQQRIEKHRAAIQFRKAGYSDHALIHLATPGGHSWTLLVEAFLDRVQQRKGRVTFADEFYSNLSDIPPTANS